MFALLRQIFHSAILWIYAQTIWLVLVSAFYHRSVPWVVWGSLAILLTLRLVRNPPSDAKTVLRALGADPYTTEKDDCSNDGQGNGKQYCMRVVAHRGGGYDYPENSLSAFRNVKSYATHINYQDFNFFLPN